MKANLPLNVIEAVVHDFYAKATQDVLIGYHFRKIQDFSTHLPRIVQFWELQLLGRWTPRSSQDSFKPFDLLGLHLALKLRPGQLDRWLVLFKETLELQKKKLNETQTMSDELLQLFALWEKKLQHFRDKFLAIPGMFGPT